MTILELLMLQTAITLLGHLISSVWVAWVMRFQDCAADLGLSAHWNICVHCSKEKIELHHETPLLLPVDTAFGLTMKSLEDNWRMSFPTLEDCKEEGVDEPIDNS